MATPGEAVRLRARREAQLFAVIDTEVTSFIDDAAQSLTAAVTRGWLSNRWERVVHRIVRTVETMVAHPDRPLSAMYLRRLPDRLRADNVPNDVYEAVTQSLAQSARRSRSREATTNAATDALKEQRTPSARRLARTEATASYNFQELDFLAYEGFASKVWVPVGDAHTRNAHLAAAGQTVRLAEPFDVGGDLLMVPGDPQGSPAMIANCRCVIVGDDPKRRKR